MGRQPHRHPGGRHIPSRLRAERQLASPRDLTQAESRSALQVLMLQTRAQLPVHGQCVVFTCTAAAEMPSRPTEKLRSSRLLITIEKFE